MKSLLNGDVINRDFVAAIADVPSHAAAARSYDIRSTNIY